MYPNQNTERSVKADLEQAEETSLPNALPNTHQKDRPRRKGRVTNWLTFVIAIVLVVAIASLFV